MTKEPKLNAAVRIVAEWSDYDQEIKRFQTKVKEKINPNTKIQQGTGTEHNTHTHTGVKSSNTSVLTQTHSSVSLPDVHTEL